MYVMTVKHARTHTHTHMHYIYIYIYMSIPADGVPFLLRHPINCIDVSLRYTLHYLIMRVSLYNGELSAHCI